MRSQFALPDEMQAWYQKPMKKPINSTRSAKTGQFVLSSRKGEKISAVEGMKLSSRMGKILTEGRARGLSGDEQRALIMRQVAKK